MQMVHFAPPPLPPAGIAAVHASHQRHLQASEAECRSIHTCLATTGMAGLPVNASWLNMLQASQYTSGVGG